MNSHSVVALRGRFRVAHVSSAHPWTDNRVHLREAAALAEGGYSVALVAVDNDASIPETGVRVLKLRKRGRLGRFFLGSASAVALTIRLNPNLVHLHDPELAWSIPLFRILGKRVIYDAHEDLPAQIEDKYYLNWFTKLMFLMASHAIVMISRCSTHVIAATEKISERYTPSRVTVVHNYPRLRDEDGNNARPSRRQRSVVYVGGLERERGPVEMVRAMADPSLPDKWVLELAGVVKPYSLLGELKALPGWGRVNFRGEVSPNEAREMIAKSRIGLVTLLPSRAFLDSLPTKMFEYLAAGTPVIASDFPLWRAIIDEFDCGILVDPSSPSDIAQAIRRYADDPDLLDRHGENAKRAAAGALNWACEEVVLLSLYDRLLTGPKRHGVIPPGQ